MQGSLELSINGFFRCKAIKVLRDCKGFKESKVLRGRRVLKEFRDWMELMAPPVLKASRARKGFKESKVLRELMEQTIAAHRLRLLHLPHHLHLLVTSGLTQAHDGSSCRL